MLAARHDDDDDDDDLSSKYIMDVFFFTPNPTHTSNT